MKRSHVDPGYPEPDANDALVQSQLQEAPRHIRMRQWRLVPLRIADMVPRENIHWIEEKDFREWKGQLIEALKKHPWTVKPIMVWKIPGRPGKYVILDGHHRWRSAKLGGVDALWAIETDGKLREPLKFERQRVEA